MVMPELPFTLPWLGFEVHFVTDGTLLEMLNNKGDGRSMGVGMRESGIYW